MDPQSMPIDQTGETIVFVLNEGRVEAHIQVQYDADANAERFAWLIPVMAEPDFAVGSQQLFINLQNSTVPSYGYANQFPSCGGGGGGGGGGWDDDGGCSAGGTGGNADGDAPEDGGAAGDDGGTTGGGVDVVQRDSVGAFDIVVLQADDTDELMTWLADNEYYQDPAAAPILDEYIAEGAMFAAVRLNNGADVGEIHPITLSYDGDQPCVPLRLTRIAAQPDMDIRVFLLGERRAYPTNYRHVSINPVKLDWIDLGGDYKNVVTMAVDSTMVDGHGFVTEYAGLTTAIDRTGLQDSAWDEGALASASALQVPELLTEQNLLACSGADDCSYLHPLIQGLLATYLPVPDGLEPGEFYSCIECYEDQVDLDAWDANAFTRDVRERIFAPGRHAESLLDDNPIVTRLYTTLSPHEMTLDPTFHIATDDTPGVDLTAAVATLRYECDGTAQMELRESARARNVSVPQVSIWPDISPDQMPWAELVTENLPGLAPVVLVDNGDLIDELVAAWNQATSNQRSALCEDDGLGPDGGAVASAGSCGCQTDRRSAAGWLLMLLALTIGRWSRRDHHQTR